MNTIESLMREMEEDRRQRRIATLSDTTQVDGGVWKVEPSPNACPTCLEFSRLRSGLVMPMAMSFVQPPG